MPEMAGIAASRPGVSYLSAPSSLVSIASWMTQAKVLEKSWDQAKTRYRYPGNLKVVGKSCGKVNAFYSWESETIVVCYEVVDAIVKNYQAQAAQDGSTEQQRLERFWASINFVTQHEFGHAALHNQRTPPSFGNPESEADNFAFVNIIDVAKSTSQLGDALFGVRYALDVFGQDTLTVENLADEHDLAQKRYLNFACLVAGASNEISKTFIDNHTFLPVRVNKCRNDWRNRRAAMRSLLSAQ